MTDKYKGTLQQWDDAKSFGFIEPRLPGPRVFVHINDFVRKLPRPESGMQLVYQLTTTTDGKTRAIKVVQSRFDAHPLKAAAPAKSGPSKLAPLFTVLFSAALAGATYQHWLPAAIAVAFLLMSLITFGLYAWDKSAARAGRWRTSEATLLLAGLLGGWPGAVAAQHWLRHKSVKTSFRLRFWATVSLNCCFLLLSYEKQFFGLVLAF